MRKATRKKTRLFVLLTVMALLIVSATVLWFGRTKTSVVATNVEQVSVEGVGIPEGKKPVSGIGTLADLRAEGKDLECQVVYERAETDGNIEGTYFTSRGNTRGDFMVPAPEFGGKIVSSMIVGGNSMYVWSKIGKDTFGFKSDTSNEKTKQIDTKEPVPLNAQVKYSCTDWASVDGSVFMPPAEVQFKDLNVVIDAGMEYGN